MGVGNNTRNYTFANIRRGKIVIKEGETYKEYGYVEGRLTDIQIVEDEYQGTKYKKLCLILEDGIDRFNFQMKLDSGYGRAVCSKLPNCDFGHDIKFQPTYEVVDDKPKTGMFLNQGATAIKAAYTNDNPNGRPPLEKAEFKGKVMYDNTEQLAFYENVLLNEIKPKLQHPAISGPAHQLGSAPANTRGIESYTQPPVQNAADITEPVDDLPF